MKNIFFILFTVIIVYSCKVEPKEINYGKDHCYNCDMTIVDNTHAAQYVTKKGRSYSFDAVECLIWKLVKDNNEDNMEYILVADYVNSGKLIDAKSAVYLISDNIKSPMGANLSAFSSKHQALNLKNKYGGELYNWKEIKKQLLK
jgi:copper chaperone NosL